MASGFYVAGPSYVQVGTGTSGALQHLGWSVDGWEVEPNAEYEDVMCDLGGSKIGTDVIYQGQDAIISGTLNFYNETVLNSLLARIQNSTTGAIGSGQIGGLMISQSLAQRLLIVCPYSAQAPYSTNGMTAAYNFLNTYLVGAPKISLGTKVKTARVQWRAIPAWSFSGGLSSATLFNASTTGIVATS